MAETSRGLRIALWVVSGLLTALYLFAGFGKVSGNPQAIEGFAKYGYSDAFRLFIGASELAGAVGLWIPKLSFWAAAGLIVIMLGAVYTHVSNAEAPTGPVIALILLGFVAWSRRGSAFLLS
jgi:putative oxidoreductase